jgi:hypothetical protein
MATDDISRFLLKRQGLVIPEIILKQEFITEFDKKLQEQSPILVALFLKKVADDIDHYIDVEKMKSITTTVAELETSFSSHYGSLLTTDDEQILIFITQMQKNSVYDFLEIAGPLYFSTEIIEDLEKNKELYSDKIKICSSLWLFSVIFEQILHMVDRRVLYFLTDPSNPLSNDKFFLHFKNRINRQQYHGYATAGEINNVLSKILSLDPQKNLSIFGSIDNPKNLRNKISHSGLFFDSERNRIVCLDGSEYEIDEFLREFYKLFQFLFKWIELSLNKPITDPQISNDLSRDLKSGFYSMSSDYKKEHRFYYTRRLSAFIVWVEKEIRKDRNTKAFLNS